MNEKKHKKQLNMADLNGGLKDFMVGVSLAKIGIKIILPGLQLSAKAVKNGGLHAPLVRSLR